MHMYMCITKKTFIERVTYFDIYGKRFESYIIYYSYIILYNIYTDTYIHIYMSCSLLDLLSTLWFISTGNVLPYISTSCAHELPWGH